ncbi:hypothetical protein [Dyadobacter bucti]|uniref:hypothetical protein n=1 Tax=Dyadobacter bucti TaxID=2572203 RepID=UPI001109EAF4|nr:hypothetical protein [Dyadobacter bucti]
MEFGSSAIVSLLKAFYDIFTGRKRIRASLWCDQDDYISIINDSDKAISIDRWELVWQVQTSVHPQEFKYENLDRYTDDLSRFVKIPGKDRFTITFSGEDKFDWNPPYRKGQKLFIELYMEGSKKPLRIWLFDTFTYNSKR